MTPYEFDKTFALRVKEERKITNEILHDILHAEDEKFHLKLGFSSLFDWLTTGHGYWGSAAQRRIQAARLLRAVPSLSKKLESGATNLSVAAKAQSAFAQKEKLGLGISKEDKADVIAELEGKSTFHAEQKLMEMFPELEQVPAKDSSTVIAKYRTRMTCELSERSMKVFERIQELLSHQHPEGSMNDILLHVGEYFLKKEDPLRKETRAREAKRSVEKAIDQEIAKPTVKSAAAAANRRVKNERAVSAPVERITIRESDDRCEFCDPLTGRRCNSRYQIQTDHIHMRVFGGGNERQNLRRYCRAHNILAAEQKLGRKWANHWKRKMDEVQI